MRNPKRFGALATAVVIVGAALGGTATAQEVSVEPSDAAAFGASASADALTIDLFDTPITGSAVTAEVKPDFAKATVTETLVGPVNPPTPAVAEQPGGEAEDTTESCTGQQVTELPGVVRFDVTCGTATAAAAPNTGTARGLGAEVVLEPSVSEVLDTLQIQDPATEATNELFDQINSNLVEPLTGTPLEPAGAAVTTVQDVLSDVLGLQSTARVVIAPALADVEVTDCLVASTAESQGIRVELLAADVTGSETAGLLPEDLEAGEPLVTLILGKAKQSKTVSRCDAAGKPLGPEAPREVTEETVAAVACIELGTTALGTALGLPEGPQCLEGGQTVCVLADTPLASCISLAAASADGGADAGSIQLFTGVNGGVDLATGRALTAAQETPPAAPAAAAPAGELPRTGGPAAMPVIGGALLAAAAVARRFSRAGRA